MINAWSNGNSPVYRRRGSKPLAVLSQFSRTINILYNERIKHKEEWVMNVKKYVLGMLGIFISSTAMFKSYDIFKEGLRGE